MSLQITNIGASTLNGAINDAVTTLDVVSASSFPTSGDFWINVENEIMKVTGVSSNTFTVTRGVSGGGATAAASHSSGSTVTQIIGVESFNQLRADITRWGTYSTMTGLTDMKSGDVFHFDGTDTLYDKAIYNGSTWDLYFFGIKCGAALDSANFTSYDGAATYANYGGAIQFSRTSAGSRAIGVTAPSTPYTATFGVYLAPYAKGTGINAGFSDGTKSVSVSIERYVEDTSVYVTRQSTWGTFASNIIALTLSPLTQPWSWIRITDDGTDRFYYISTDGRVFNEIGTTANTDYLTTDRIFVRFSSQTSNVPHNAFLFHYKVT